jgi:hypothetical protein
MLRFKGDFNRMGSAIEQRFRRCASWWRPHLEATAHFVSHNIPESNSVAVLGAGRLLDIDLLGLLSRCRSVHLFDADSSAVSRWRSVSGREYGRRVFGHVLDLTGSMQSWTKGLAAASRGGALTEYLQRCETSVPSWAHESFDGYISLNILGQIPLYWRDRVFMVKQDLLDGEAVALEISMGRLQCAHLEGLAARSTPWAILITDTEYYSYRSDESEWRVESALCGDAKEVYRTLCSGCARDRWLWHVAPQFVEDDDEGEIHLVEACAKI